MNMPTPGGLPPAANAADPAHAFARIFLSHSHLDDAFTLRLAEQLRAAGAYVWVDMRDIKEGDFLKRINEGLAKCDWLVLVETPASLSSPAVEMEVNAAQNRVLYRQMRGVIRFVAAARDPRSVPPTWATLQYYDATANYSAALARLLDAVREPEPAGAPTPRQPVAPAVVATPAPAVAPASPEQAVAQRLAGEIAAAYDDNDWHAVADKSALLLRLAPDTATVDLYRMRGRALLELGDGAGAVTAFAAALKRDPFDLPTLRATARAHLRAGQPTEAAPLLQDALALVSTPDERLDILREYVPVLQALNRWGDVLARCDEALRLLRDDPSWLALRLDALTHLGRTEDALAVARQLAERPQAPVADWVTLARLTADATHHNRNAIRAVLDEAERRFPAGDAALATARRELLPPLVPRERFPERLERLGFAAAERENVGLIVPPVCPVPAGPFLMGNDPKQDSQAYDREQPQQQVTLAAFAIGKFPVTVAEYACFVAAGHAAPGDWSTQQGKFDHPVVRVSWHDAMAYAAWLARLTGQPWALPSEAQWEKAARWDPARRASRLYPWGDRFEAARCNTRESSIGTTTAVGTYGPENPARDGSSPCGAQDMAGNVWEWTSTLFKPYPYTESDGHENPNSTENRVLRGGSWYYDAGDARAAYRYGGRPDGAVDGIGFRVALLSVG